jgi:hypothetical protein
MLKMSSVCGVIKKTYCPVVHAYHEDPDGHVATKAGREDDDMV